MFACARAAESGAVDYLLPTSTNTTFVYLCARLDIARLPSYLAFAASGIGGEGRERNGGKDGMGGKGRGRDR